MSLPRHSSVLGTLAGRLRKGSHRHFTSLLVNPSLSMALIIHEVAWDLHPTGISSSTHGIKLKLLPEMQLDKRCYDVD